MVEASVSFGCGNCERSERLFGVIASEASDSLEFIRCCCCLVKRFEGWSVCLFGVMVIVGDLGADCLVKMLLLMRVFGAVAVGVFAEGAVCW